MFLKNGGGDVCGLGGLSKTHIEICAQNFVAAVREFDRNVSVEAPLRNGIESLLDVGVGN